MSWWQVPEGDLELTTQVVVVGAGAGGTLAALTLAEAGVDVVLLEHGYAYAGAIYGLQEATRDLYLEAGFRTTAGRPPLPIAGGRGLGGSTLVNSALCFRTPSERVEEWNELADGVFADTEAYFAVQDEVEAVLKVAVTPDHLLSGNDRAEREAARALGWAEGNLRRNAPTCVGCGRCNQGCTVGGKWSVDKELLPRAAAAGARIFAGCRVDHVEAGRVAGAVYGQDGVRRGSLSVRAEQVVLAGGAIHTPRLLLDSGAVATGGPVGQGLRVQPVVSALGYFPDREIFAPGATQGHFIDEFVDDDLVFEANPTLASMLAALPFVGSELQELLSQGHRWANTGVLIRDRTEGRVLRSRGSNARIHYDLVPEDLERIVRALRLAATLWFEGLGAERVVLTLFGPSAFHSMDEVMRGTQQLAASRLVLYSSHPQASCALGRALDGRGMLPELPDVYVMDASALPSNVGRNPQISVMTVARILAERLVERRGARLAPLAAPA